MSTLGIAEAVRRAVDRGMGDDWPVYWMLDHPGRVWTPWRVYYAATREAALMSLLVRASKNVIPLRPYSLP